MTHRDGKRGYTMSDEALEQRRQAASKSTGPKTEAGKAASSRNAWKHGLCRGANLDTTYMVLGAFGKPCRTTCPKYPCGLVDDEITRPGGDCLDKEVYVRAFEAITQTLQSGDVAHGHAMLAGQVAGAIEILNRIREELAENGLVMHVPLIGKDGGAIMLPARDEAGNPAGEKPATRPVLNPIIPHYTKLLDTLGLNLPEMLATPRSVSKIIDPDNPDDPVTELFGNLARAFGGQRRPRTIEHKSEPES
jgi:hypothetical protein